MEGCQSSLNDIPVEILRLIIAPLAKKDLKALREMNQRLYSVASETLFESIALTTNDASYVQLLNIAASDEWSAQVRHIDWVLLHAIGNTESLTQILQFNEPWVTALRKWRAYEVARARCGYPPGMVYSGLSLQCRLVQKFRNVQSVRFWSADNNQRIGREPWEYSDSETRSKAIGRNRIITADRCDIPSPEDIFSILKFSNLRLRLIKTVAATVHLRYSTSNKFLKGVQIQSHQDSLEYYRGAPKRSELDSPTNSMNCCHSLARSGISSLTILRIFDMRILVEDMQTLLKANINLRYLYLGDVELSGGVGDTEPLANFLLLLSFYYEQGCLRDLRVILQSLRRRYFLGRFSASEQEVQAWMKGEDNDELLKAAIAALEPVGGRQQQLSLSALRSV